MTDEPPEPRTGLGRAADAEPLDARGLLAAVGGVLGIVESVLPPLVFVVLYQIAAIRAAPAAVPRATLIPIVVLPLVLSGLLVLYRIIRRQRAATALGGALVVGISAVLVLVTGDANTNYVPGLIVNAVYGLVFLVSVLVRRPIVGLAVGLITSDTAWRADPSRRRASTWLTLLWVVLFAVRLAVELPLFLAGNQVVALGIARIVLGLPLYSIVLVVTVLTVQAVRRRDPAPGGGPGGPATVS